MTTVIVGCGLIGGALRDELRRQGRRALTVSRSASPDGGHLRHDLGRPDGRAALRADLDRIGPGRLVLTHGPSDVTWMEEHERAAAEVHREVARLAVDSGVPTLLISTDNVFSGERGLMRPTDPVDPRNAYGRIKAETERIVLAGGGHVLRVSLVYGHAAAVHRATYAQRCLAAAAAGAEFAAPTDQSFTPIHVDDVARVVAALVTAPAAAGTVAHLAGPEELSRFEFARLAYAAAGADPDLVRPCLRRDTAWASRPRYSSLACTDYRELLPAHWPPAAPAAGLRRMVPAPAGRFAIDAGGSRTRVRVEPAAGPARTAEYPTVNRAATAAAEADATLARILADVRDWIGAGPALGWLASAATDERGLDGESERVRRAAARLDLDLVLSNDIVPMLWGPPALGGSGVAVVCGTGSGFFGAHGDGRTVRVGGCEYLGSDEGSACDLGWHGLRAAVRAADGRGPDTKLLAALETRTGGTVTDLARQLAGAAFPKRRLAELAPAVCATWLAGDAVAAALVEAAVEELALGVRTVAARLELPPGYAVAALGGVLRGCPEFFAVLRARLVAEGAGRVELIADTVATVAEALRHVVGTDGRPVLPPALRPHARLVRP